MQPQQDSNKRGGRGCYCRARLEAGYVRLGNSHQVAQLFLGQTHLETGLSKFLAGHGVAQGMGVLGLSQIR